MLRRHHRLIHHLVYCKSPPLIPHHVSPTCTQKISKNSSLPSPTTKTNTNSLNNPSKSPSLPPSSSMAETRDFLEWELLHNSETGLSNDPNDLALSDPLDNSKDFIDIHGVSEVIIRSDYFTSDSMKRYSSAEDIKSVVSDNPSWVEPCSRYLNDPRNEFHRKNSGEFWSDSSCNEPIDENHMDENQEFRSGDYAQSELGFDEIREIGENEEKLECLGEGEKESVHEEVVDRERGVETAESAETAETAAEVKGELSSEAMISAEGERKGMVWWKLPFEIVKFCLFKVSPTWSIAVAAAVMGIVILRRRLHKMKRKSRMVPLTLMMEDKKVSQFMKNAARLNDAFSVVKRAPIIRPLLPATPGVTPWPMISLR